MGDPDPRREPLRWHAPRPGLVPAVRRCVSGSSAGGCRARGLRRASRPRPHRRSRRRRAGCAGGSRGRSDVAARVELERSFSAGPGRPRRRSPSGESRRPADDRPVARGAPVCASSRVRPVVPAFVTQTPPLRRRSRSAAARRRRGRADADPRRVARRAPAVGPADLMRSAAAQPPRSRRPRPRPRGSARGASVVRRSAAR